ncbi:MAG: V-type ATP synthase subunit I [Clostridiaceae bacterium]|nr:V-type ATP synthase subunit I [Clostridiaceae bacterium]
MPIVKMEKLTVIGLREERDPIMDTLMRLGAVELIEPPAEQETSAEEAALVPERQAIQGEISLMSRLEMAIDIARRRHPVKRKMFSGRRQVDAATLMGVAGREKELLGQIARIEQNQTRIAELRQQLGHLATLRDLLQPWEGLDLDLKQQQTAHVQVFLGSLDTPEMLRQAETQLREEVPESLLTVLSEDEGGLRCAAATLRSRSDLARSILRKAGFSPLPEIDTPGTPSEQLSRISGQIREIQQELARREQELDELAQSGADFEVLHDFLLIRHDRLKASSDLPGSQHTFWLQGWVPAHLVKSVARGLESRFMVALSHEPAGPEDEYPILLSNSKLVKPYEVIVEMFSPPSTREQDPTPLLAPFFFFFFGMMLSDIGYGLLLSGLCALLLFKVKAKGEMGRMVKMLFLCGISSVIWGFLFGSFFGDMVSVLSQGRLVIPALWFNPMDDATKLMIWSMIFGVIHLFAGMGAKAYLLFVTGRGKDAVLDIFPWYLIIAGLGILLGGIGGQTGLYLALTGASVLVLFGGRGTRNPVMRLLKGLLSLYDITSYISDILSYTRILALVLATSVIAMVVNLLGFLGGPSITGFFFYVLVAILGHGLNLALSALSAYVHTSRLHYVEFFGKFYDGGGRLWRPLTIKTRYVDIVRSPAEAMEKA